jgi:hypothetical protein
MRFPETVHTCGSKRQSIFRPPCYEGAKSRCFLAIKGRHVQTGDRQQASCCNLAHERPLCARIGRPAENDAAYSGVRLSVIV